MCTIYNQLYVYLIINFAIFVYFYKCLIFYKYIIIMSNYKIFDELPNLLNETNNYQLESDKTDSTTKVKLSKVKKTKVLHNNEDTSL